MSDITTLSGAFRHRELVTPPDSENDKPVDGYEIVSTTAWLSSSVLD